MKKSNNTPNGPSQRQLRAAELIRHIISETLRRGHFHDKALVDGASISVSEVRCSPDLKNATAYVMSLGGKDMETIIPALNNSAAMFQKEIGANANLKFTPKVRFVKDEVFENAAKIEDILNNL